MTTASRSLTTAQGRARSRLAPPSYTTSRDATKRQPGKKRMRTLPRRKYLSKRVYPRRSGIRNTAVEFRGWNAAPAVGAFLLLRPNTPQARIIPESGATIDLLFVRKASPLRRKYPVAAFPDGAVTQVQSLLELRNAAFTLGRKLAKDRALPSRLDVAPQYCTCFRPAALSPEPSHCFHGAPYGIRRGQPEMPVKSE
jgi:hypothetical protein